MTRQRVALDEPAIALGSVYDPPDVAYPRLLVMRRWPRGIAKGAVDQWERDLGPSNELLDAYRDEEVDWPTFEARYREEMTDREPLVRFAALMARYTGVTLLCSSHSDEECHRSILAQLVLAYLEAHPDA
jgi:uncharacterized protein YeaO (DUF488 family)